MKTGLIKSSLRVVILLAVLAICAAPFGPGGRPAQAQTPGKVVMKLDAGYGGNIKPYSWLPVHVQIENTGSESVQGYLQARFTDAGEIGSYYYPLDLPAGAHKEVALDLYAVGFGYQIEIDYYAEPPGGRPQRLAVDYLNVNTRSANDLLFGVVASAPSAFNALSLLKPVGGDTLVTPLQLKDIPESSLALASLSLLVFCDVDTSPLSQRQVQALTEWVYNGGRLVVCGGPGWQKTSAGLLGLLPLAPNQMQNNTGWQALDQLALANQTLSASQGSPLSAEIEPLTGSAMIATGTLKRGAASTQNGQVNVWEPEVLATSADQPLAVRQKLGNGEVFFLAFDPQRPPFIQWTGMENIFRSWFGFQPATPPWSTGINDWYNAANAAQTLPNLTVPPILFVCGFLMVYVMVLGPLNYIILRRLKRGELAWVTIPGLVLAFSLVVFISGGLTRGQLPILNRLAVVQVWSDDSARFDGLVGVYSPERTLYRLNFGLDAFPHLIPNRPISLGESPEIHQVPSGFQIPNLMVDISGITPIALEGHLPAPDIGAALSIQIDANGAWVDGELYNASPVDLEKAALITPSDAIPLGDLKAGETRSLHQQLVNQVSSPTIIAQPPSGPNQPYIFTPINAGFQTNQIEGMMGTSDFYQDRETYRRYSLLMGLLQNTTKTQSTTSSSGYFLTGWTRQGVLPVSLDGKKSVNQDTTFYIIQVQPALQMQAGELKIPAELFSWKPLDTNGAQPMPYQMYLYGGENYSLEFSVNPAFTFDQVSTLALNLQSPNYVTANQIAVQGLAVSLWDFEQANWVEQPDLLWGNNDIRDPARFVSGSGAIRLKVENSPQNNIVIAASDFTLVVKK